MRIDRKTKTFSLARSFHSAQGLPVRARRQGWDRQELPSVLVLFHFRVSSAPPRLCARHKHFSLARSLRSLKALRRRGVQLNPYCTDTLLFRSPDSFVLLSGSSSASLRLCASMVLRMPCCSACLLQAGVGHSNVRVCLSSYFEAKGVYAAASLGSNPHQI